MPQVKDKNMKDGWYVNTAVGDEGPRPLSLGAVITFKPGQERFLKASVILQSRDTHKAFLAAMANGNIRPRDAAVPEPPPPPAPEPEVIEVPEPEPEPETEPEIIEVPETETEAEADDKPKQRRTARRRGRSGS